LTRRVLLAAGLPVLAGLLAWGFGGLPDFGHYRGPYGDVIARVVVPERHATSLVTAVVFDYRGVDTLGEEFILLAASAGCVALLRLRREEREEEERDAAEPPEPAAAARSLAAGLVGPVVVVGLYVVGHGQLTPGGGFQGGVILAAALLLAYAGGHAFSRRLRAEPSLEGGEALGAAAFALLGVAGLVAGSAVLQNVLPLGETGQLISGGTLPVANLCVGLEVTGGVALILSEFLDQALLGHT
jgi:multicomponent Na+:H+ antiporter subunit B